MSSRVEQGFFVNSVVSELFTIEGTICSTRTADLYKAFDRERMRPVNIWILRSQFLLDDPILTKFSQRLSQIATLGGKYATLLTAGIDPSGVIFAVIAPVDGIPLGAGNLEPHEAERRFIGAVSLLDQLHRNGVVCGDICPNSFWFSRSGEVQFVGIMGTFESDEGGPMPPVDSLSYLAPEQRTGNSPSVLGDVYSLGILGYQLFTGRPPVESPLPSLRQLVPAAAPWLDEVLSKCVDSIPNRRYASASAVLSGITETKERILKEESAVRERQTTSPTKKLQVDTSMATIGGAPKEESEGLESGLSTRQLMVLGGVAAFLVALILGGGLFFYKFYLAPNPGDLQTSSSIPQEAVGGRMREALAVIEDSNKELQEKKVKFEELAQSDDPLAHSLMIRSALEALDSKERILVEQSLIRRASRLGLKNTAEAVQDALDQTSVTAVPPEYEYLLRALDGTLPPEARSETLQKIFERSPDAAVVVGTGMLLDASDPSLFMEVVRSGLRGQIGDVQGIDSPFALLLASGKVPSKFIEPVFEKASSLSGSDTKWLLEYLVRASHPLSLRVATIASQKKLYSPLKLVYLTPLLERDNLPEGMSTVLFRAVSGDLSKGDVEALGMWMDEISHEVLFAICADDFSIELKQEAIEYLTGRGLSDPSINDLLQWIKGEHWEQRAVLAQAVGSYVMGDKLTEVVLEERFSIFKDYTQDEALFKILLESPKPAVARVLLKMYRDVIPKRAIVQLLGNSEKPIRLAAIEALKFANEVEVLNAILAYYNVESDPEVKDRYKKELWVIRQRDKS